MYYDDDDYYCVYLSDDGAPRNRAHQEPKVVVQLPVLRRGCDDMSLDLLAKPSSPVHKMEATTSSSQSASASTSTAVVERAITEVTQVVTEEQDITPSSAIVPLPIRVDGWVLPTSSIVLVLYRAPSDLRSAVHWGRKDAERWLEFLRLLRRLQTLHHGLRPGGELTKTQICSLLSNQTQN